jgi:hypothetical protein
MHERTATDCVRYFGKPPSSSFARGIVQFMNLQLAAETRVKWPGGTAWYLIRDNDSSNGMTRRHPVSKNASCLFGSSSLMYTHYLTISAAQRDAKEEEKWRLSRARARELRAI